MDFNIAFERVLGHEAGYSNDPNDPGGETKYGISKRSYPNLIIKDLTEENAKDIYLHDFWNRINADKLPSSIAFQVFDFAVNSGIETAIRYLQKSINVADDGYWGPVSQAAIDKLSEPDISDTIMILLAERLDYMTRLSNWTHASRGWAKRIAKNLRYGALDS